MDDEDRKVQDVIRRPNPSNNDTMVLKKILSSSVELQHSHANLDVGECKLIQHLIDVTEVVAANPQSEKSLPRRNSKKVEPNYSDVNNDKEHSYDESCTNKSASHSTLRNTSSVSHWDGEWHSDLLGYCSEPLLCIKTFFCPCGTFSKIAIVATNRHMSLAEVCNELMAYSMILSGCCYTCCIRRKLCKMLNIKVTPLSGGFVDDFLSHLMCCCCTLV
ncbi:Protein MID1-COMPLEMENTING ACTIVITY 1, partial [Camellia lanceoleosa]